MGVEESTDRVPNWFAAHWLCCRFGCEGEGDGSNDDAEPRPLRDDSGQFRVDHCYVREPLFLVEPARAIRRPVRHRYWGADRPNA